MNLSTCGNDVARDVRKHQKKNKSYWGKKQVPVEIGGEELRSLTAVGFSHEEKHGGGEGGAEPHEAIHVDDGNRI